MARELQALNDLRSLNYCCHRIIELNQQLEVINHKKLGLSHDHIDLTKEQQSSTLPMPKYQHEYVSPLGLMEKAEDPEDYYINVIMQDKIKLYLQYVENASFWYDIKLIFRTFYTIIKER